MEANEKSKASAKSLKRPSSRAFKGEVPVGSMKIREIELARDGIYFWHVLFSLFGLSRSAQPYRTQPSVLDHYHLFRTLQLNHPKSSNSYRSYRSIVEKNNTIIDLWNKLNTKQQGNITKKDILAEIDAYFLKIKHFLEDIEEMFILNKNCNTRKEIIETLAKKTKIQFPYKDLETDLCRALNQIEKIQEVCFEKNNLKTVGTKRSFAQEFFTENSSFQKDEIQIEFIEDLLKQYEHLLDKENFPEVVKENPKIYKANVVTANLYVKYEENQYENIEIDYDDKLVLHPWSFGDERINVEEQRIRQDLISTPYFHLPNEHHSEKALMISLGEKVEILIEKLKKKIKEKDIKVIEEIGLQIFSIRDYCDSCKIYLSNRFEEQFQKIKNALQKDCQVVIKGSDFQKYCSYNFDYSETPSVSHLENKGRFVIDNENYKSYFSEKFLKDCSTYYDNCSWNYRTYFMNAYDEIHEDVEIIEYYNNWLSKVPERLEEQKSS